MNTEEITDYIHPLINRAASYATKMHEGQYRKYGDKVPYIVHPVAVASMVAGVHPDDVVMIAAALLHDVVEDTPTEHRNLVQLFGEDIALVVKELTDCKDKAKSRMVRKAETKKRLAAASYRAKTIKLADIIHNMPSIIYNDPAFAKTYIKEKEDLLPALDGANEYLYFRAKNIIDNYFGRSYGD